MRSRRRTLPRIAREPIGNESESVSVFEDLGVQIEIDFARRVDRLGCRLIGAPIGFGPMGNPRSNRTLLLYHGNCVCKPTPVPVMLVPTI